jgi:hypothetical protein
MTPAWSIAMADAVLTEEQMTELYERAIRFAREECQPDSCPIESDLVRCVQESLRIASEGTTILTYIPVLAMRRVRDCITAGSCETGASA